MSGAARLNGAAVGAARLNGAAVVPLAWPQGPADSRSSTLKSLDSDVP